MSQSLLFDLFKAFDYTESSPNFFFPPKVPIVLYAFADCSELLYICTLDFKTVFHASDCSIVIILNGTSEIFVLLPA